MNEDGFFAGTRKVAVIGATGQMGSMFCSRFAAAGIEVAEIDVPLTPEKLNTGLSGAHVVLLSVPASVLVTVLKQLQGIIKPPQILADVTSVKVQPMQQMQRYYNGPVVGTHPLFGGVPKEDEVRVAVVPAAGVDAEATAVVDELFTRIGCDTFETSAEEHDEAAALVQGLNFVTTVSYFATLAHKDKVEPYLTPSFLRRLDAAQKMLTKDAELFEGLFEANPFSQDAVRQYRSMLNIAAGGDVSMLVDRALWWWRSENNSGGVHTEHED